LLIRAGYGKREPVGLIIAGEQGFMTNSLHKGMCRNAFILFAPVIKNLELTQPVKHGDNPKKKKYPVDDVG
jgi:hypothetical protein